MTGPLWQPSSLHIGLALAVFTKIESRKLSFRPPFQNAPSAHDTQKLPVHVNSIIYIICNNKLAR